MNELTDYDNPIYLLGVDFNSYELSSDDDLNDDVKNWSNQIEVSNESNVRYVRPIPFTPILVDGLSESADVEARFWGTDKNGLIYNLSYLSESKGKSAQVLLRHNSPITTITNKDYDLLFPPAYIIGQLTQTCPSISELKDKLKPLYINLINKIEPVKFKPSRIAVSQLAPLYEAEFGQELSDSEKDYNEWHEKITQSGQQYIKGFAVPSVNTVSVVFSSDMYIGAQVSLIKYQVDLNDKQQSPELVLASGMVTQPFHKKEDKNSESYVGTLPSATMHLPTAFDNRSLKNLARGKKLIVKDGYYILRVQFWLCFRTQPTLSFDITRRLGSSRAYQAV